MTEETAAVPPAVARAEEVLINLPTWGFGVAFGPPSLWTWSRWNLIQIILTNQRLYGVWNPSRSRILFSRKRGRVVLRGSHFEDQGSKPRPGGHDPHGHLAARGRERDQAAHNRGLRAPIGPDSATARRASAPPFGPLTALTPSPAFPRGLPGPWLPRRAQSCAKLEGDTSQHRYLEDTMRIGILGSGAVAKSLAGGFLKHGHQVMLGTRDGAKLAEWVAQQPAVTVGSFADAAGFGELVGTGGQGHGGSSGRQGRRSGRPGEQAGHRCHQSHRRCASHQRRTEVLHEPRRLTDGAVAA